MRCAACGEGGKRKTVMAMVVGDGPARAARVCAGCASAGTLIVAVKRPIVVDAARAEREAQKDEIAPFVARLKAQATAARTMGNGATPDYTLGRIEAIEDVIGLLKSGRP